MVTQHVDRIALAPGGSWPWPFIFIFLGLIAAWMILNTVVIQRMLAGKAFDPFTCVRTPS